MPLTINNFLRNNGLKLRSVYSWEATGENLVVFKLWQGANRQDDDGNPIATCLSSDKPGGPEGARWDTRREAVLKVLSAEWRGFATLGHESMSGKQRIYTGFATSGFHRVLSISRSETGSYLATLSRILSAPSELYEADGYKKAHCEVFIGDVWRWISVAALLASGNHRRLQLRCPKCHGPIRLEKRSGPDKKHVMPDRFEHASHTLHGGCPFILSRYSGEPALSPFALSSKPSADIPLEDEDFVTEEEAARLIGHVPDKTTRDQLVKARLGQGRFRSDVVQLWGSCSVTKCLSPSLLMASHILPWREANNEERLDPFNALLLSPTLDRLFDKHFISFSDSGEIIFSTRLCGTDASALGVTENMRLRTVYPEQMRYLAQHREQLHQLDLQNRRKRAKR